MLVVFCSFGCRARGHALAKLSDDMILALFAKVCLKSVLNTTPFISGPRHGINHLLINWVRSWYLKTDVAALYLCILFFWGTTINLFFLISFTIKYTKINYTTMRFRPKKETSAMLDFLAWKSHVWKMQNFTFHCTPDVSKLLRIKFPGANRIFFCIRLLLKLINASTVGTTWSNKFCKVQEIW